LDMRSPDLQRAPLTCRLTLLPHISARMQSGPSDSVHPRKRYGFFVPEVTALPVAGGEAVVAVEPEDGTVPVVTEPPAPRLEPPTPPEDAITIPRTSRRASPATVQTIQSCLPPRLAFAGRSELPHDQHSSAPSMLTD
jgi:hypothetical protein